MSTLSFGDTPFDETESNSEIITGWDNKGLVLGLIGENSQVDQIRIVSKDPINEGTFEKTFSVGINLDINTREIYDDSDNRIRYDDPDKRELINENKVLTMKLRQVDYCDADGNEKHMLVFASEPFEVEEE